MRLIPYILIVLILRTVAVLAQELPQCGIVLLSEAEENAYLTAYRMSEPGYLPVDSLILSENVLVQLSDNYSGNRKVVVPQSMSDSSVNIDIYSVSLSGVEYIERMPQPTGFTVIPREAAWSYDGRFVLLHNILDIRNDRLFIYDIVDNLFYYPTQLSDVFYVAWAPDQHVIAFVGYDYIPNGQMLPYKRDYSLYIAQYDGSPITTIFVDEDTLSRFQWLSSRELAVTSCYEDSCQVEIHDIESRNISYIEMGNYLIDSYLPAINSYLLSAIGDRNLFLLDESGELTQLTDFDLVLSKPILSSDGTFVSIRVLDDVLYKLIILRVTNPSDSKVINLSGDPPEVLASNRWGSFPARYGFYYAFDEWHPQENLLLVADENAVHVFDAIANTASVAIENIDEQRQWNPSWLCP